MQARQKTSIRQLKNKLRELQDMYNAGLGAQVSALLYWFSERGFYPAIDDDTDEYTIPYDQLIPLLNAREIDIRVKEMNEWLEEARKTRDPARRRQLRAMIRVAASWFYSNAPNAQLDYTSMKYKVFYTALRPGYYFRILDKNNEEGE